MKGHKQMLGQAAAMLVSLPAGFTAKFDAAALPTFLGERLTVAGPSHAGLLEGRLALVTGHVIQLVVNCTVMDVDLSIRGDEFVARKASGRRWQATDDRRPRNATPRHRVTTGTDSNGQRGRPITSFVESGGDGGDVGGSVGHALAAGNSVIRIQGARHNRVGIGTRVRLS